MLSLVKKLHVHVLRLMRMCYYVITRAGIDPVFYYPDIRSQ